MLPPNKDPMLGQQFALLGETVPDQHSLPTPLPQAPTLVSNTFSYVFLLCISSSGLIILWQTLLNLLLFF